MSRKSITYLALSLILLVLPICLNKWSADAFQSGISRFINPIFILAFALLGLRAFVWLQTLKLVDISTAFPLMSLSFPFVLLISFVVFDENFTINNLLGSAFILAGILLISLNR